MRPPDQPPFVERFELALLGVPTPSGTITVPVVDGWIELQMTLLRVPNQAERGAFFAALASLCAAIRARRPDMRWYFLHKAPGLKLRFQLGVPEAASIAELIGTIAGWSFAWIRPAGMGSVFDQTELMPAMFRDDATRLLTHAADELIAAALADRRCSHKDWSAFLVKLLGTLDLDEWLAQEALSRLRRLRTFPFGQDEAAPAEPLLDPSAILACRLAPVAPGFAASVSLLQTINLTLNLWGVDAGAQRRILESACAVTRPPLMEPACG